MTTPGGAGTSQCTSLTSSVLGPPASVIGSELSRYVAPALRFAPSRYKVLQARLQRHILYNEGERSAASASASKDATAYVQPFRFLEKCCRGTFSASKDATRAGGSITRARPRCRGTFPASKDATTNRYIDTLRSDESCRGSFVGLRDAACSRFPGVDVDTCCRGSFLASPRPNEATLIPLALTPAVLMLRTRPQPPGGS
jgi:hypothetical protein